MSQPNIHAFIMAAGASVRFGGRKQLALIDNVSMITRKYRLLAPLFGKNCHVVLGSFASDIQPTLPANTPILFAENWKLGLGHSISDATQILLSQHQPDAILITLCDQVGLTDKDYAALLNHYDSTKIICCDYGSKFGVPALFPKNFFTEISMLSGEKGAQALLNGNPQKVKGVSLSNPKLDIDTQEDLAKFLGRN